MSDNDILQLSGNKAKKFLLENDIKNNIKRDLFYLDKKVYDWNKLKYRIEGFSHQCKYYNEVHNKNTKYCDITLVKDTLYNRFNLLSKETKIKIRELNNNNTNTNTAGTTTGDTTIGGKKNKYNDITVKQLRQLVKEKGKSIKKRDGTGYNTKQQLISKLNR